MRKIKLLLIAGVASLSMLFAGCGSSEKEASAETSSEAPAASEESSEVSVVPEEESTEPTAIPDNDSSVESESVELSSDYNDALNELDKVVKENIQDLKYTFEIDEDKDFVLDIVAPDGFAKILNENPEGIEDAWNEIIDGLTITSKYGHEYLTECGLGDSNFIVEMLNDEDTDYVLVAIMNGEVYYNVMQESND